MQKHAYLTVSKTYIIVISHMYTHGLARMESSPGLSALDDQHPENAMPEYLCSVQRLREYHIYNMGIQGILATRHIDHISNPIRKQDRFDAVHIYTRLMFIHDRHIKCIQDFPGYPILRQMYLQTVLNYLQAIKPEILAESFPRWRELDPDGSGDTVKSWNRCEIWSEDVEIHIMQLLFDTWEPFRALHQAIGTGDYGLSSHLEEDSVFSVE